MPRGLLQWLRQAGASSEGQSSRDGFLSHAAESHAAAHGLYDGMKSYKATPGELPDIEDVQDEKPYYKFFYVVGTILQVLILVVVLHLGL